MNITEIRKMHDPAWHGLKTNGKFLSATGFPQIENPRHTPKKEHMETQMSLMDIFQKMKQSKRTQLQEEKTTCLKENNDQKTEQQSPKTEETETAKTDTTILVKPDGSRVLVITVNINGMETAMSLEISKPTDAPDNCRNENSDQQEPQNNECYKESSTDN